MNGLSRVNWRELYLSMQVGEERYLFACSRKYVATVLNAWRRKHPENSKWFRIEAAYCPHDGMEGMIITRLSEPSMMQVAAQKARRTKAQQREAVGV